MPFKDIKGQDAAVDALKKIILKGRIPQGIIFSGNSGVGRYLTSLNFAKALNCRNKKSDSCGVCPECRKIDAFNHPDVFIINSDGLENSVKISHIRQLHEHVSFKKYESDRKICIIRDADKMTPEAQNALLKCLENVSFDTVIILIVSDIRKIFSTVASRCQQVVFKPLEKKHIKEIILENFEAEPEQLDFILSFSEGSAEKALKSVNSDFLKTRNKIFNLLEKDKAKLVFLVSECAHRQEALNIMDLLISYYRDLFLFKLGLEDMIINKDKLLHIKKNSGILGFDKIHDVVDILFDGKEQISNNANIKLAVGNNMLNLCMAEEVI